MVEDQKNLEEESRPARNGPVLSFIPGRNTQNVIAETHCVFFSSYITTGQSECIIKCTSFTVHNIESIILN